MSESFDRRKAEFLEGYGKLVLEFKCDFLNKPVFIPDNSTRTWQLTFEVQLVDTSEMPVVSPFSA